MRLRENSTQEVNLYDLQDVQCGLRALNAVDLVELVVPICIPGVRVAFNWGAGEVEPIYCHSPAKHVVTMDWCLLSTSMNANELLIPIETNANASDQADQHI